MGASTHYLERDELAAGDPVGTGLVASLARPGGNVTHVPFGTALFAIVAGVRT